MPHRLDLPATSLGKWSFIGTWPCPFIYVLLSYYKGRVEWLQQRPYDSQSLKYLFCSPLQKVCRAHYRKSKRNSLVVQWLRLDASTAEAQVQSLVRELRSCKPNGTAKKKKKFWKLVWVIYIFSCLPQNSEEVVVQIVQCFLFTKDSGFFIPSFLASVV